MNFYVLGNKRIRVEKSVWAIKNSFYCTTHCEDNKGYQIRLCTFRDLKKGKHRNKSISFLFYMLSLYACCKIFRDFPSLYKLKLLYTQHANKDQINKSKWFFGR